MKRKKPIPVAITTPGQLPRLDELAPNSVLWHLFSQTGLGVRTVIVRGHLPDMEPDKLYELKYSRLESK